MTGRSRERGLVVRLGAVLLLLGALALHPRPASAGLNAWTTGGPLSTSIPAVATDPLNVGTVYAGSSGLGMFRSDDGGLSWNQINVGLANLLINAIAFNPQTSSTLYAGTNGGGVFVSQDKGNHWAGINSGLSNQLVAALAVDPQTPTTLYAGTTGGGVFKTANGGVSWVPANTGLANTLVAALAINQQTTSTLYAGTTGGGVFKSVNGGGAWTLVGQVNTGLVNTVVTSLAIDPQFPTTLYAGTSGGGIFKTFNGGASWVPANNGLTNQVVRALAIDPQLPTTLFAGTVGGGVFLSVDGGATWSPFNQGLTDPVVNALAVTLFGTCVHAGTLGSGVFDQGTAPGSCGPTPLAAAVLPSSRSVQINGSATAFATIVNSGQNTTLSCAIAAAGGLGNFLYQTTDPATNQLTGSANTPVNIPAGGLQTFLIAFTPLVGFAPTEVQFAFGCFNTPLAPVISGVNSIILSASPTPVPDLIVLAATSNNDGIVNISPTSNQGAFSVATINIGAGGSITATADTGVAALPVTITLCATDATAQCLQPAAASVTQTINTGDTPTYSVFVTGTGRVGFNPALNRIFVRFRDGGGVIRGSASVAGRTQ